MEVSIGERVDEEGVGYSDEALGNDGDAEGDSELGKFNPIDMRRRAIHSPSIA